MQSCVLPIYGGQDYFTRRNRPRAMRDLAEHDWIGWAASLSATPPSRWMARHVPACAVRVRASAADLRAGRVQLQNTQWFRDLSWLRGVWAVTVDGTEVQSGKVPVAPLKGIGPRGSAAVALG